MKNIFGGAANVHRNATLLADKKLHHTGNHVLHCLLLYSDDEQFFRPPYVAYSTAHYRRYNGHLHRIAYLPSHACKNIEALQK